MLQSYFFENRTLLAADATQLNIGVWRAAKPVATLFYIHGLQSHSGWLYETGPALAGRGVNVIALDRRGSGRSGGLRGHASNADVILEDYHQALDVARDLSANLPVLAMGQSFGGSILAAMMCRYNLGKMALIFSAAALGQQRFRLGPHELNRRRASKGSEVFPIELRDLDYSRDEKYLRIMANDSRIVRMLTTSMRSSMIGLEDIYHDNRICLEKLDSPIHFFEPCADPIVNMKVSKQVLQACREVTYHLIDIQSHYMEFSAQRYELWDKLVELCAGHDRHEQHA